MLTENELELLLDRKPTLYEATVTDELGSTVQRLFETFAKAAEWVDKMERELAFRVVESGIKKVEIEGGEKVC